jgi:hypothetical protein
MYFFLPRGAVGERCLAGVDLCAVDAVGVVEWGACFPDVVFEEAPPAFVVLCFDELVEDCASYRFPSAEVTISRAHSTIANTRAVECIGKKERTGFIVSM